MWFGKPLAVHRCLGVRLNSIHKSLQVKKSYSKKERKKERKKEGKKERKKAFKLLGPKQILVLVIGISQIPIYKKILPFPRIENLPKIVHLV